MSRLLEKVIVKEYLYPLFTHASYTEQFADQFAFRPTGSTTSAIIQLTHTVSEMLGTKPKLPYVHVISLDFSKALDTGRHHSLTSKLANLPLPDLVFNWIVEYLNGRVHCTKFNNIISSLTSINSSIIQGSGLGPATNNITAHDLHPVSSGNVMVKYADDTYLLVPSTNTGTIQTELDHIQHWSTCNNLSQKHPGSYG